MLTDADYFALGQVRRQTDFTTWTEGQIKVSFPRLKHEYTEFLGCNYEHQCVCVMQMFLEQRGEDFVESTTFSELVTTS
jgi:hypothetical protein